MPRGNGMGPTSQGPRTGSGGSGQMGQGRGRMGEFGLGAGGNCICPSCGKTAAHQRGVPCTQMKCPQCGTAMTRAG